jgi:hypothetical protein
MALRHAGKGYVLGVSANRHFGSWRGKPPVAGAAEEIAQGLFATRPIFHKLDETIRGHVSCSFLALVLKKELEDRIAELGKSGSWPEILADLDSLTETEVEQNNKRFLLRSAPRPAASLALRAVGVALPPTVRQVAEP